MKIKWKLQLNSTVQTVYWQNITTFEKPTIICLTGRCVDNDSTSTTTTTTTTTTTDSLIDKLNVITLDNLESSNNQSSSIPNTTTDVIPYSQIDIVQFLLNYDITSIDQLYSNLTTVNVMTMILRYFEDGEKQYQQQKSAEFNIRAGERHVKILVTNLEGAIAIIQIPLHMIDRWSNLIANQESLYSECIFTNLSYVDSIRVPCFSEFGSILQHYIAPSLRPTSDTFNCTILSVREDSNFLLRPHIDDGTIYKPDSAILSLSELPLNDSIVSLFWHRLNVQAVVEHVHVDRELITIFITSLNQPNTDNGDSNNSVGNLNSVGVVVRRENLFDHIEHLNQIQPGVSLIFQDIYVQPPSQPRPAIPLLVMDKFSQIFKTETLELTGVPMNSGVNTYVLGQPQEFISLIDLPNGLLPYYQSIVNIDGVIIDCNKTEFLYRGCLECQCEVAEFQGDQVLGYDKEKFFCSKCRQLVDSELMVELRLVIKIDNWTIHLKINNIYCSEIFEFPLEHKVEKEQQYTEQLSSLVGKNININGILTPTTTENEYSEKTAIFNIEAISCPNIYQIA
ncbi:hypothetical protein PPL_10406 [Heterostelium album PN500]|uniref:Uncharacterized protein n=1 Tax=Heterostelium pallidum (strain ATCC 26659 / Pp 5 / PN500) TaxID=670386 RepID=D3BR03_HETP5|nr:hypothetical protein PPL_10406 [Heterostelium album PN500]EFA76189.1 hypothetical protein PPL_10406 [Heterostelium album PN500]|eukprot:XP_020428322.1 hypothetical protein PPL_10406 [Heterostelium album PN500]